MPATTAGPPTPPTAAAAAAESHAAPVQPLEHEHCPSVAPQVPWPEHVFKTLQSAPEMHALLQTHWPEPLRVPLPSHTPPVASHALHATHVSP